MGYGTQDPNDPTTFPTASDANAGTVHTSTYPATETSAFSGGAANYVGGSYQPSMTTGQHPSYKVAPEL